MTTIHREFSPDIHNRPSGVEWEKFQISGNEVKLLPLYGELIASFLRLFLPIEGNKPNKQRISHQSWNGPTC